MVPLTDAAVHDAILSTAGNLTYAAQLLGRVRTEIFEYVVPRPALSGLVIDLRDQMVDDAHMYLRTALLDGQPWAIQETLRTLGQGRGYGGDDEWFDPLGPPAPAPEREPDFMLLTEEERARAAELLAIIQIDEQNSAAATPGEPPPKKPPTPCSDQAAISAAIVKKCGHLWFAAADLGWTRGRLKEHIAGEPVLQAVLANLIEELIDLAETGLRFALHDKKPWAICFIVRRRGPRLAFAGSAHTACPRRPYDLKRLTREQLVDLIRLLSKARGNDEPAGHPEPAGVHPVDQS